MTEAEKNEIVGLVMTEISSQAVDFDIATEQPQANDLLTAVRENESGGYKGVTIKWDDVARIATELANQAATRAEQAKTNVENMKASVEQTVTDFNALAEEKKQEVQGVYQNDLDELKGDLVDLQTKFIERINILDMDGISQDKYINSDGTLSDSTSYGTTGIMEVKEGDILYPFYKTGSGVTLLASAFRFIYAMDKNRNMIEYKSNEISSYTVPSGVCFVKATIVQLTSLRVGQGWKVYVYRNLNDVNKIIEFQTDKFGELKEENNSPIVKKLISSRHTNGFKYEFTTENSSIYESEETFDECGGYSICLRIDTDTFRGVTVGKGNGHDYGAWVKLTETKLEVYYRNEKQAEFNHGLTFKDYVSIRISAFNRTARANIYIDTNGGSYKANESTWDGRHGKLFVIPQSPYNYTCNLSYFCDDWLKDIWLFGDSYVSIGDLTKWTSYFNVRSHNKIMINGFPGRTSQEALLSLNSCMKFAKPKKIIWCLGMNDADPTALEENSDWKKALIVLTRLCEENSIELIVAKIPNVPSYSHVAKNKYISDNGYRFIDFPKAVNANYRGSTWYSGMLSSDNVHPTEQGALSLYTRVLYDVPELS